VAAETRSPAGLARVCEAGNATTAEFHERHELFESEFPVCLPVFNSKLGGSLSLRSASICLPIPKRFESIAVGELLRDSRGVSEKRFVTREGSNIAESLAAFKVRQFSFN